jgi:hypothetical protein
VAEADRKGVSPGSDALREVFGRAQPCLILIDEWVAYGRQLYDVSDLPGGSFDANLIFAQALTEAVRAVPRALVVATAWSRAPILRPPALPTSCRTLAPSTDATPVRTRLQRVPA